MRSVNTLVLGMLLAAGIPGLYGQTAPAAGVAVKPAPAAKQDAPNAAKPAAPKPTGAKATGTKTTAKSGAKASVKKAPSAAAPAEGAAAPSSEAEGKAARRDPFESLISRQQAGAGKNLPPGKAGLQVSTLRLDGIVRAPNGMIAVVSNPQLRTYFLREGDQLYDGRVEKIAMDGVSFHEVGKDAFGKPVERQVSKRIYASSAGEQQ
jgi:Tfp pilus assembly protein PilP